MIDLKVTKHLGKVHGECVWAGGLHSILNEYGECRGMTLTATKAHNQFMPVLAGISHSLWKYGHDDIQLVFTDNPKADKPELERVLPSLSKDVVPIQESLLPHLPRPPWPTTILDGRHQIGLRCNLILDELDRIHSTAKIRLSMDMEWPVDLTNGIHGPVSILTLAHNSEIFIFQVCASLRKSLKPPL